MMLLFSTGGARSAGEAGRLALRVRTMIVSKRACLAVAVVWAVILAGGCDRPKDPPGVVATVNGRPVTLGQLEFHHDLRGMGLVATENPSVDQLRRDYGRIMADLIIRELVLDELAKAGVGVSDADVAALEARIRADYPGDTFDRMLFEENIDPARWRNSLTSRIALERFVTGILSDRVKVDVKEAAEYYKEHVADFKKPAMVTFVVVRGPDRKRVEQALRDREAGRTVPDEAGAEAASVHEARLPRERVPGGWLDILGKLRPGQASPVVEGKQEAMALVLVGETPAVTLDPATAYPLVERALVEKKRNEAFAAWLAGAVAAADIRISAHLLRADAGLDSEVPSPDILEKEFPGVGDLDMERRLTPSWEASREFAGRFAERPGHEEDTAQGPPAVAVIGDGEAPTGTPRLVPDIAPDREEGADVPAAPVAGKAGADTPASPAGKAPETDVPGPGRGPAETTPQAVAETASASAEAAPASPPAGPGKVEFLANKASWIIFRVDGGQEERVYVKGGKTHAVDFKEKLAVRLGSPSDVTYRYGGREERVESSSREVKTLDFP